MEGESFEIEQKGPKTFQEHLNETITNREIPKRAEFLVSPFQETETISVDEMPEVCAIADPHMVSSQASREGIDGMASFKRRLLGNLPFVGPSVIKNARMFDTIARYTFRKAMEESEKYLTDGGMFMVLGDTVISSEAANAISGFKSLEASITLLEDRVRKASSEKKTPFTVMNLVGNHYSFVGIEKKDYEQMSKIYPTVDNETFLQLISAVKQGYSWSIILEAWTKYRGEQNPPQMIFHPFQKWYLEKLTYGSQIGRYVKNQEGTELPSSQVVFLDNLIERGGTSVDVVTALKELNIEESSPIYTEILEFQKKEEEKQKTLIEKMLTDCKSGVKTVVFTHWPELMQDQLIGYVKTQFGMDDLEAKTFVEDNIQVWGGHRHLAEHDLSKQRKGVIWVKSITREFISFLGQQPFSPKEGRLLPFTARKPFRDSSIDYPELVTGTLDTPQKTPLNGIAEGFDRRMDAISGN